MAKLTILVFLALFAFAHVATAFKATITTTVVEDEDENSGRKEPRCIDQFRTQQQLLDCQMHLREKCRSSSSSSSSVLLMSISMENPDQDQDQEEGEQYTEQCCKQLRNMDERCRCLGLQLVVRREQKEQRQRERGQEVDEIIVREAENLPSKCNISPLTCSYSPPRW